MTGATLEPNSRSEWVSVRGHTVFIALLTVGAVLLISDVLDTERHRTFHLVIVAIMFGGAALDLMLWIRRQRAHRRAENPR